MSGERPQEKNCLVFNVDWVLESSNVTALRKFNFRAPCRHSLNLIVDSADLTHLTI